MQLLFIGRTCVVFLLSIQFFYFLLFFFFCGCVVDFLMYRAELGFFLYFFPYVCAVFYAPLTAINFNLCVKRKRKTPSSRVCLAAGQRGPKGDGYTENKRDS